MKVTWRTLSSSLFPSRRVPMWRRWTLWRSCIGSLTHAAAKLWAKASSAPQSSILSASCRRLTLHFLFLYLKKQQTKASALNELFKQLGREPDPWHRYSICAAERLFQSRRHTLAKTKKNKKKREKRIVPQLDTKLSWCVWEFGSHALNPAHLCLGNICTTFVAFYGFFFKRKKKRIITFPLSASLALINAHIAG